MNSEGPKKVVLRKKGTFTPPSPPAPAKSAGRYPVRKPAAARRAEVPKSPKKPAVSWRAPSEAKPAFPELLAPAGSVENYFAAVAAGADAVYLGLQQFNARERAENITLSDLCRILPHAHSRKVRIYLTINTLLTEPDLPDAIALLHQVAPLGPDAVIAADLGLVRLLREHFPDLPVHISTQAGCASADAAEEFARLGASRVVLERHLRMPEVKRIAAKSPIGVEVFIHGSMCYSYSGKCFFSSFLGGKSGNRGACVQPCRRLYGHEGAEDALFSTRDLSLIEQLPELTTLGISSFKIEGRMRSAEYVSAVVGAYRKALDLIKAGRPEEGVAEGKRLLSGAMGREETAGLLGGAAPGEIASGGGTGSIGTPLGPIVEILDEWAFVAAEPSFEQGDRLRIQFMSDGSGRAFTALHIKPGDGGFRVKVPFAVSAGDLVFRVGTTGRADFARAAKREMDALPPGGIRFNVIVGDGFVAVEASYGRFRREMSYRVGGHGGRAEVQVPPNASGRLAAVCRTDLPVGEIRVESHNPSVAWVDVEALFGKAARQFDKDFHLAGKELRLSILPTLRVGGNRKEEAPAVFYVACRPSQLSMIPKAPSIVPVVEFTKAVAREPGGLGAGFRERGYFRLPAPLLEADAAFWRRTVREALKKGYSRWILPDIGYFAFFPPGAERRQLHLVSDHYLYGFNLAALSVLSRLGASRMILPVEATLTSLRAVGKYLHGLGIAVAYGALPLMISRALPASGVRRGEVVSPRDERFVIEADEHGSTVRPVAAYSASGILHELRGAGIDDFLVDFSGTPDDRIPEVMAALEADRHIPGTSHFNLHHSNF
ncbi:MAG TPA: U32 family peptidase [Candidatus Deferrimicrobiaceae bacterium]